MNRRIQQDEGRSLKEVAPYIERRMHGQTGSVTLHYVQGRFKRAEYRVMEDAETMPTERAQVQ